MKRKGVDRKDINEISRALQYKKKKRPWWKKHQFWKLERSVPTQMREKILKVKEKVLKQLKDRRETFQQFKIEEKVI